MKQREEYGMRYTRTLQMWDRKAERTQRYNRKKNSIKPRPKKRKEKRKEKNAND